MKLANPKFIMICFLIANLLIIFTCKNESSLKINVEQNIVNEKIETKKNQKDDVTDQEYKEYLILPDSSYQIKELIGKVFSFRQMPKGYRNIGGGLASSLSKLHDGGFWVSRFGKDSLELFVLKKPLFRDSTGHSVWEILDIIISDKEQGERFIGPSGYTIKKNSQFVYDIVALEKPDDRGFIANFRKVWLIDSISEKFIETSPDSFTCQLDM